MSLSDKAEENYRAVELCIQNQLYNAAASRAYYTVFQMMKWYLENSNFNFQDFIDNASPPDKRPYRHGNIKNAMTYYLKNKTPPISSARLFQFNNLYKMRIKADYKKDSLTEREINNIKQWLDGIKAFIETL